MVQSLERKFTLFSSLLGEVSDLVASYLSQFNQGGIEGVKHYADEHNYRPCCLIPDNYLEQV